MGTTLYLEVPEKRDERALLYEYYDYKLRKKAEIKGEEPPQVEEHGIYNMEIDRLDKGADLWISEKLSSTVCEGIDMEEVYEIFGLYEIEGVDVSPIYNEEIERLIRILREGKPRLNEIKPIANWELTLEGNQIAICEFALKNGLGIGLSM